MGACYSKSGAGASLSPPEKAPRVRKRLSWRVKRRDRDDSSLSREVESAAESPDFPQKTEGLLIPDLNSTEADPLLAQKQVDERECKAEISPLQVTVAPSDSGIESIGTVQEDSQDQRGNHQIGETVRLKLRRKDAKVTETARTEESDSSSDDETSAYISRQLQRLSRGSCHKCGNFKLDDSALTALLADTYCICGPRRAGQPSFNPQCQTHKLRHQRSIISSRVDSVGATENNSDQMGSDKTPKSFGRDFSESNEKCAENFPRKSSLKKRLSSEVIGEGRDLKVLLKSGVEDCKDNFDEVFEDEIQEDKGPREALKTHFGSIENSLENFSLPAHQRRSLLSEILDITDSICHCDFYSNEIFCSPQDPQELDEDISKSVQCVTSASTAQQQFPAEAMSKSSPALYSPSTKKCHGSSKNVSFAMENVSKSFSTSNTYNSSISFSKGRRQNGVPSSSFDGPKNSLERLSSLGSTEELVVSGSSSEDDMASIAEPSGEDDLVYSTEACRKTLSYSSVQQLVENTKEITIPKNSARRMFIDGHDSVVIPTEVYRQLEADLSIMKEQLLFLSSLMLEDQEEETSLYDTDVLEESFA